MVRSRRLALALLLLVAFPAHVCAQAPKAGVVTTLEGKVTAVRTVAPQPVPLRFKDDVYLQDKVVTAERSLARLLLGGKAVVTVRERSTLSITEIPGQSTIGLESGKIALGVARDRMQRGEVIRIRTPNAIASVRGTVIIAELECRPTTATTCEPVTTFHVLRGLVEAVHIEPATGNALGAPVEVGALERFIAIGSTSATKQAFGADDIAAITSGLQPRGVTPAPPVGLDVIKAGAIKTAAALLTALLGPMPDITSRGDIASLPRPDVTMAPLAPSFCASSAGCTPDPGSVAVVKTLDPPSSTPETLTPASPAPPPPFPKRITGTLVLAPGETLVTFKGESEHTLTEPLVQVDKADVSQLGADDLITVDPAADVSVTSPLLSVVDSRLAPGADLLAISGTLTSTAREALVALDPTSIVVPGHLVSIREGGRLTLSGPLFSDIEGTLLVGGDLVSLFAGAELDASGTASLLSLVASSVTTGGSVLSAGGGEVPALIALSGPLLAATSSTLKLGRDALALSGGATLLSATVDPLLQLDATSLSSPAGLLAVGGEGGRDRTILATLQLAGPLLSASNDSALNLGGALVSVGPGGQLVVADSVPALVTLTGGAHAIATASGRAMFELVGRDNEALVFVRQPGTSLGGEEPILDVPLLYRGPLLDMVGASVTTQSGVLVDRALLEATAPLLHLRAGSMLDTALDALTFSRSAVTSLGTELIRLDASTLNVASGALVSVNGGRLSLAGDLLHMRNGARLTIANGTILSVDRGGVVDIAGFLVRFGGVGRNAISVTNTLAPTGFVGGIPVFSALGGTEGFIGGEALAGQNGRIRINGVVLGGEANITGSLISIGAGGGSIRLGPAGQ